MKKKSKVAVSQTTAVVCLTLLVTTHAFTDNRNDDTTSGEITLAGISSSEESSSVSKNIEEDEGELSLFSLENSTDEITAFSGGSTGILIGSLPGYAGSANKALEIGHQVRQAQLTMLSPQQQLDAIAVSVSAASLGLDLTQQSKRFSIMDSFVYDKAIAKVKEYVNIRAKASTDSEVVGKLYKNSYGTIVERGEKWTKISSGNVAGYINNDYLYFDGDALEYARAENALNVNITAGSVNIRTQPNTDCEILLEATKGMNFLAYPELSTDEFYAVEYKGQTAYVTKKYSEVSLSLKKAISKEEEAEAKQKAKEKADQSKKQAEIKKSLVEAKKVQVSTTNRKAITVSDEEIYLLATVIASEALSESYEGKLAVANVIINRLISGKWGNSISDVVYAKGQFSGSSTGRFERFEKLMNEDCKKAAVEALAGVNNIGDFLFFRTKGSAKLSSYSKYYILGNHCFYQR